MAQPPSGSGGDLGFDLDLYGAAPEWFGWRPRFALLADKSKGESLFLKSLY